MSNQQHRRQKEEYIQVVKDFLRLLEEKNIPALIDLWADDGINSSPDSSGMTPRKVVGKQAISETRKGVPELFKNLSFPLHAMYTDVTKQTATVRFEAHNILKGGTGAMITPLSASSSFMTRAKSKSSMNTSTRFSLE